MTTKRISDRDALELARGRVPGRADLDELADLLTEYRSAVIGTAPRPSAALAAKLDLSATPIAMQRDGQAESESKGRGARRAASGLFGMGLTVTIILGAASGAAAVVGAGSAGLLPPGAQDAFDRAVSIIVPPGVVGQETTDQGEAPGESGPGTSDQPANGDAVTPGATEPGARTGHAPSKSDTIPLDEVTGPGKSDSSNGSAGTNGNNGNAGTNNGNSGAGNNGNGNGNSGTTPTEETPVPAEEPAAPGNSGSSNGNAGNGNAGNGNGNGNSGTGNNGNDKDKGKAP
jgi:hypothetical protein